METFSQFVRRVVTALNGSRIDYMLTGAMASSYYGRPRTTLDVDVVISCGVQDLPRLAKNLEAAGLQVDSMTLRKYWESTYRIVTATDKRSPHTLDIIFTDQRLMKRSGRILGVHTYYQSPESLILAKLRMLKATIQPEKAESDREDVKAILMSTKVNLKSLRKDARTQDTFSILTRLIKQISPISGLKATKRKRSEPSR
jgi:hypothetical protein